MWNKIKGPLQFLLGWPLSFVALFFIIKTFLPALWEINTALANINYFLLFLGFVSFFIYYTVRSIFWARVISFMGYPVATKDSLFLWSSAQLKRYIPGNIWGVLGMTVLFSERGVQKKDVAKGILFETEIVVLSTLLLSFLALPYLHEHNFPFVDIVYPLRYLFLLLYLVGTVIYLYSPVLLEKISLPFARHLRHFLPPFSSSKTLFLLLLMTVSYIFFGIGTFLTITSVVYIDPQLVLQLSGYFILSLIIGFLSFITPTGLGVREGAIAFGLSHVITLSLAGFAALFSRIVLVAAEILFVFLAYLLAKVRNRHILKDINYIRDHLIETSLVLMTSMFALYFSVISVLRYEHYYTGRFDLGNMTQTVWNTLHGNIFQLTNPNGTEIVSRLAFHADFILVLFAPFYLLWESPNTLLILQAVIVACGAFFVYALSQMILKNKALSLTLSFLYLINPSIQRAVIYDFHAVTLATTFLLGAFYFMLKKQYKLFLLFAFLAGITKEQIWAIISLFGLYIAVVQKKYLSGLILFALSVLICYLLIWVAIPQALGTDQHFAVAYYSGDEDAGPSGIIKNALFHPIETVNLLLEKDRVSYIKKLLSPLGYTPLLAPLFLIFALPDLTINLLSGRPQLYQIYYQYTAAITPFLFVASVYGLRIIRKKLPRISISVLVIYLTAWGLYSAYAFGPLPGSRESNLDMLTKPQQNKKQIDSLLLSIPESASVAASNGLGSHLSHRRYIFTLPYGYAEADYILFEKSDPHQSPSKEHHLQLLTSLRQNDQYILIYDDGNVTAFRKRNQYMSVIENPN